MDGLLTTVDPRGLRSTAVSSQEFTLVTRVTLRSAAAHSRTIAAPGPDPELQSSVGQGPGLVARPIA